MRREKILTFMQRKSQPATRSCSNFLYRNLPPPTKLKEEVRKEMQFPSPEDRSGQAVLRFRQTRPKPKAPANVQVDEEELDRINVDYIRPTPPEVATPLKTLHHFPQLDKSKNQWTSHLADARKML